MNHGVPVYTAAELAHAVESGGALNLTYSQLLSLCSSSRKHATLAISELAQGVRTGHPHVYKLQLTMITNEHLAKIKSDYDWMLTHLAHFLRSGQTLALAKNKNSVFHLDADERAKTKQAIFVILLGLKAKLDADCRAPYASSYRKGMEGGMGVLAQKGVDPSVFKGSSFTVNDAKELQDWNDFHDEATANLVNDVMARVSDIFTLVEVGRKGAPTSEAEFIQDIEAAASVESYRLPMYAWMGYSVAEAAQLNVFKTFDVYNQLSGAQEWKYAWETAGDEIVCPICEEYGNMKPRFLDEWPDDPGSVHVFCRCDLRPVAPEDPDYA